MAEDSRYGTRYHLPRSVWSEVILLHKIEIRIFLVSIHVEQGNESVAIDTLQVWIFKFNIHKIRTLIDPPIIFVMSFLDSKQDFG